MSHDFGVFFFFEEVNLRFYFSFHPQVSFRDNFGPCGVCLVYKKEPMNHLIERTNSSMVPAHTSMIYLIKRVVLPQFRRGKILILSVKHTHKQELVRRKTKLISPFNPNLFIPTL